MNTIPNPTLTHRLIGAITATVLVVASFGAHATQADPGLAFALDGIWQQERPAVTVLANSFNANFDTDPPNYETSIKKAPTYTNLDGESAQINYLRKHYPVNASPWGPLPQLDAAKTQLFEIGLPNRRYLVISAPGTGLYSVADWQRFGFLHVLDVTNRAKVVHYPLVAEAGLQVKVLGRLPGSPVLNYARLVPSRWVSNTRVDAYEVLLYALQPKGVERVVGENGKNLSYVISRVDAEAPWTLQQVDITPIAMALDHAGRAFSAPAMKGARAPEPAITPEPTNAPAAAAATTTAPHPAVDAPVAPSKAAPAKDDKLKRAKASAKKAATDTAKDAAKDTANDAIQKKLPQSW